MKQAIPKYEPPTSVMQFQVSIRMDLNEMTRRLKPEQIEAVMQGIAKVVAVNHRR